MTASKLSRRFGIAAAAALGLIAIPFAVAGAQTGGFRDVPKDHWAADSVSKLVQVGIIKGYPAAPFAPVAATGAKPGAYDGNKPVTRYELAVTLYRFVQYVDRAAKQPKGKLPISGEPKSGDQAAQSLIAAGYLPKTSPLAKNGSQVVTAQQFTDALSQVLIKTREDVAPPSPDSQPDIKRPNGGGASDHSHASEI